MTGGEVKDIAADREVILACGAIASLKVLMLSGVGEAKALRSLGIPVVENSPFPLAFSTRSFHSLFL